jgi:hypothetical protein
MDIFGSFIVKSIYAKVYLLSNPWKGAGVV